LEDGGRPNKCAYLTSAWSGVVVGTCTAPLGRLFRGAVIASCSTAWALQLAQDPWMALRRLPRHYAVRGAALVSASDILLESLAVLAMSPTMLLRIHAELGRPKDMDPKISKRRVPWFGNWASTEQGGGLHNTHYGSVLLSTGRPSGGRCRLPKPTGPLAGRCSVGNPRMLRR